MAEQKHFSYEANINLKTGGTSDPIPEDVQVRSVRFLTPAEITLLTDGKEQKLMVGIDLVHQKVVSSNQQFITKEIEQKILNYLFAQSSLPDNQYEAGDEIYDQVERAREEHEQMEQMKEST